jgi:hypothetical protein
VEESFVSLGVSARLALALAVPMAGWTSSTVTLRGLGLGEYLLGEESLGAWCALTLTGVRVGADMTTALTSDAGSCGPEQPS